jgi:hypothetical protein
MPELIGPVAGEHVLVFRNAVPSDHVDIFEAVFEHFAIIAAVNGHSGENAAAHVPLVVILDEGADLELVDAEAMRAAGWVRA